MSERWQRWTVDLPLGLPKSVQVFSRTFEEPGPGGQKVTIRKYKACTKHRSSQVMYTVEDALAQLQSSSKRGRRAGKGKFIKQKNKSNKRAAHDDADDGPDVKKAKNG